MTDYKRPDPDLLLKQFNQSSEEQQHNLKGKLKVFLGYCAGVGKTYRMLQEANLKKKNNVDIVIGVVETHGRKETEELTKNLEIISRVKIEYSGIILEEMDLDAVLSRKPQIVIVDELAHSNVPSSRHIKRYQDVEEILKAGIDVYTTLNIQHLESLNDIVYQVSKINVDEKVPDKILELADEVELVDLTPEKLLERLKEGKVYIPDKAKKAMKMFFTMGNLLALRELALRYTAKQVDVDMLSYMEKKSIQGPWSVGSRLLVGITASPTSELLIRHTYRMAKELNSEWYAVHVESQQQLSRNSIIYNQLEKNIALAAVLGGKIIYLSGPVIADEIVNFARSKNVTLIIAGLSHRSKLEEFFKGSVLNQLVRKCSPINVLIVGDEKKFTPINKLDFTQTDYKAYVNSFLFVLISVLGCCLLREWFWVEPVNFGILLLIPAIASGILWGTKVGLFSSLLAVASFDFFFIPPFYTFRIGDIKYLPSFVILIFVCIITSFLAEIVRWQIEYSRKRELFMSSLYTFTRDIIPSGTLMEILNEASKNISEAFNCEVVILLFDNNNSLGVKSKTCKTIFENDEYAVANWVYTNGKAAGKGTNTLSKAKWHYEPLKIEDKTLGVLGVKSHDNIKNLSSEELRLLQSFANIIALTINKYIN